jgi:hypothetical protein
MAITVIDNLDNLNKFNIFNTVTTAQAGRCYIDYTHRFFANNTQAKKNTTKGENSYQIKIIP